METTMNDEFECSEIIYSHGQKKKCSYFSLIFATSNATFRQFRGWILKFRQHLFRRRSLPIASNFSFYEASFTCKTTSLTRWRILTQVIMGIETWPFSLGVGRLSHLPIPSDLFIWQWGTEATFLRAFTTITLLLFIVTEGPPQKQKETIQKRTYFPKDPWASPQGITPYLPKYP